MPDGRPVEALTLGSPGAGGAGEGVRLTLLTLGATVHRLEVTGGDGVRRNVALGHPTVADYLTGTAFLGGTIGRYANRIAHGRFTLDGREVAVGTNDRGHSLHGGPDGFDKRVWDVVDVGASSAELRLTSPDGDQGFPGTVEARVRYAVDVDQVRISYEATTDAPTVVSLTNHTYVNLDGAGTVDDHLLTLAASRYTPIDDTGIPLGDHAPVDGTPFDFRAPRRLGAAVRDPHEQVRSARGIDHNLVLDEDGYRHAATVESTRTRTRMEVWTDQPGLQVYTGNALDGSLRAADGTAYRQGDGLALEPQHFPDSPNRPTWPSTTLRPGETYRARIGWVFSTR